MSNFTSLLSMYLKIYENGFPLPPRILISQILLNLVALPALLGYFELKCFPLELTMTT